MVDNGYAKLWINAKVNLPLKAFFKEKNFFI